MYTLQTHNTYCTLDNVASPYPFIHSMYLTQRTDSGAHYLVLNYKSKQIWCIVSVCDTQYFITICLVLHAVCVCCVYCSIVRFPILLLVYVISVSLYEIEYFVETYVNASNLDYFYGNPDDCFYLCWQLKSSFPKRVKSTFDENWVFSIIVQNYVRASYRVKFRSR